MSQPSTVMFNNKSRYPEGSGVEIRSLRRKTCTAPGVLSATIALLRSSKLWNTALDRMMSTTLRNSPL